MISKWSICWVIIVACLFSSFLKSLNAEQIFDKNVAERAKADFESANPTPHRSDIIVKTARIAQQEVFVGALKRWFPMGIERPIEDLIPTRDKARNFQFTDQLNFDELIDLATNSVLRHD